MSGKRTEGGESAAGMKQAWERKEDIKLLGSEK